MASARVSASRKYHTSFLVVLAQLILFLAGADAYRNTGKPTIFCSKQVDAVSNGCKTNVDILVDKLTSAQTALTFMPNRLGLCVFNHTTLLSDHWYDMLAGNRLTLSGIQMRVGEEGRREVCQQTLDLDGDHAHFLKEAMDQQFLYHMWVDDFPVTMCHRPMSALEYCYPGVGLGCYVDTNGNPRGPCAFNEEYREPDTYYLYNHFKFEVHYQPVPPPSSPSQPSVSNHFTTSDIRGYIVRIMVHPRSRKEGRRGEWQAVKIRAQNWSGTISFPVTYEVTWQESQEQWTARWAHLLEQYQNYSVLGMSLFNSNIMIAFLVFGVLVRLVRTHPRFRSFDQCLKARNKKSCWKWRLIDENKWEELDKEDVFRPPPGSCMLSALCGTSAQIICTVLTVLAARYLDLLVPVSYGQLVKWFVWSYGVCGLAGGFVSRHVYYYLPRGSKTNITVRSLLAVFLRSWIISWCLGAMYVATNLIHRTTDSSSGVPTTTLMLVFSCTMAMSVLCTLIGALLSLCVTSLPVNWHLLPLLPLEGESTPAPIPRQPCFMWRGFCLLLQGVCPFSCLYIPAVYLLRAVWQEHYFEADGILIVVSFLLLLASVMAACCVCSVQLCTQNYRWWWRSLLVGVGLAVCYILHTVWYYFTRLEMRDVTSLTLYFTYNIIIALLLFLSAGPAAFMGCYLFVTRLYYYLHLSRQLQASDADTAVGKNNIMSDDGQQGLLAESQSQLGSEGHACQTSRRKMNV